MNSSKAEAENIEPSAGKEMLDRYWAEVKTEIDDINIVKHLFFFLISMFFSFYSLFCFRSNFERPIYHWLESKRS